MTNELTSMPAGFADSPAVANLMNPQRFNQMMMIAQTMASASLIPQHLCGKKTGQNFEWFSADEIRANCFLVVNQAFRWEMDPFAVAAETYVVGGKLGFQGKLVAAAVKALAGVELKYAYNSKQGSDLAIVVYSTPNNRDVTTAEGAKIAAYAETEDRIAMTDLSYAGIKAVRLTVGQAKTANDMWTKDPEQKLVYTGSTKWTRRHSPGIILGVLTDDDLDVIELRDVTPPKAAQSNLPASNPYEAPAPAAAAPAPAAPAKGKGKSKEAAAPVAEAAPPEVDPDPEDTVVIPPRIEMVNGFKADWKRAEVTQAFAEAKYIEAGVMEKGMTLSKLTDEQLFSIYEKSQGILGLSPEEEGDPQ